MWIIANGLREPIDPHVVNTILALVALTAWIVPIANGIRSWTKKSRGESPVTHSEMDEKMSHMNGKIDSVRRDMMEKAQQSKEYHEESKKFNDENKHRLDGCVTRGELLDSRNALLAPLIQTVDAIRTSLAEQGQSQVRLTERVDKLGLDFERGISQVRIILSKLQERLRYAEGGKSGESSDD